MKCKKMSSYAGYSLHNIKKADQACTHTHHACAHTHAATKCTGTQPAAPSNGEVSLSDGNQHGSKATFSCKTGFKLGGATSITCDAKSADTPWPTPSEAPSCEGM